MWSPFDGRAGCQLIADALTQGFKLMANSIADLITALNANTNTVAARLDRLIAQVSNGNPVTADQIATLQGISDHLHAMGEDPSDPLPTPPTA